MDWRLRVLRGTIYSQIPFATDLRRFKRQIQPPVGETSNTPFAIADGLRQLNCLAGVGVAHSGTVLEMGTGWLPVIPMLFHIAGYDRIILTDTEWLMDDTGIAIARESIRSRLPEIAKALDLSAEEVAARLDRPFVPEYHAPWNPEDTDLDDVDVLISRCVFEHVPPDVLQQCLTQFHAVVRPGGHMCHVVDNSDHWQHIHPIRSRVQFLTWKKGGLTERFAKLNNYGYNNRLRHSDYLSLLQRTGWRIVLDEGHPDTVALRDLEHLRLAKPFDRYDPSDLAILDSCFVTQRPHSADVAGAS